jgi:hypothetical protein
MRPQLPVSLNTEGLPIAQVPFKFMWDLVEHLSCQRVAVSYQYQASDFTVTFTRIDLPTAEQILSSWSNLISPDRQVA